MKTYLPLVLFLLLSPLWLVAQPDLAQQYFEDAEYEKAAALYEKLYQQEADGDLYFSKYVDCLTNLQRLDEAEKVVSKRIKKFPQKGYLYVSLGKIYTQSGKEEKAKEQYQKAIDKLPADRFTIEELANAFSELTAYDFALQTYEKGTAMLKNKAVFALSIAELYRQKGDITKMTDAFLNSLPDTPDNLGYVEAMFQRFLTTPEQQKYLQTELYSRIQEQEGKTESAIYIELLTWLFVEQKDFKNAFRQAKALDRLNNEDGARVYRLAGIAELEKNYEAATDGYGYVVTEKGKQSAYYFEAQRNRLNCKRKQLTEGYNFTEVQLRTLETEYLQFINEIGINRQTANMTIELAELQALYLNEIDKAIAQLTPLINVTGIDLQTQARAKLNLGDYYLIKGENWESTLLYSQVDKAFKDDALGNDARFRNARLAYFKGDFEWARVQFDVLKSSTSKVISNDAIDISVFIMDNTAEDTTTTALQLYADAELLVFQNRFSAAFQKLDSLLSEFPKNSLEDDVFYLKARIYQKQKDYKKALEMYETVITKYTDGIRADNSLFESAELYEKQFNDKEKAKQLYERLFTEFSNSTFATEARKRFRILRGDQNVGYINRLRKY